MGRFKFGVMDIFSNRLMLQDYNSLTADERDLIDYTVKENLRSNPELRIHNFRLKRLRPLKSSLWSLTWGERIELGMAFQESQMFAMLKIVYGITEQQFGKLELYNAFAAHKWILEELNAVAETEFNNLHSEYSEEEKNAGAEDFQQFGYYNSLDALTNGNLLVQDAWLKLPYSKVFRKMCLDKVKYEYNLNMHENANRKNQGNS